MEEDEIRKWLEAMDLDIENIATAWRVMDDGDGFLSVEELASGVFRMMGSAKSTDLMTLMTEVADMKEHLLGYHKAITSHMKKHPEKHHVRTKSARQSITPDAAKLESDPGHVE